MKQRRAFFYAGKVGGVLVLRVRRLVLTLNWRREMRTPPANPKRAALLAQSRQLTA